MRKPRGSPPWWEAKKRKKRLPKINVDSHRKESQDVKGAMESKKDKFRGYSPNK